MKLSELAKEKGYTAAELVFVARAFGFSVRSTKEELDVRTAAQWRARIQSKSQLKKDNGELAGRLKEGAEKVKQEERAQAALRRAGARKAKRPAKKPVKAPPTAPAAPRAPQAATPAPPAPQAATPAPAAAALPPAVERLKPPAAKPQPPPAPPRRKIKAVEIPLKDVPAPKKPLVAPRPAAILRDTGKESPPASHAPIVKVEERTDEKLRVMRPVVVEHEERGEDEQAGKGPRKAGRPIVRDKPAPGRPRPPAALLRQLRQRPPAAPPGERKIVVSVPITIREFSQQAGIKANDIIAKLLQNGVMATINTSLDEDAVLMLALEFQREIEVKKERQLEQKVLEKRGTEDRSEDLVPRPPVVTIMGHVDHGKTTLLDRIRDANVAAGEAGGITQHIGAYQVTTASGRTITFIDTPGHEAFTKMRARGAMVTDLVVLVVAADDGVMPQTEEAVQHARAAKVPIVVAINKVDKLGINLQKVMGQLAAMDLAPEEWGGRTVTVSVSALTGQGIDDLLELLALQADLMELKANPKGPAEGVVLEARKETGRGIVATFLVQRGALRRGDIVICGRTYGRIRSLQDDRGRMVNQAGPATPVEVTGLEEVPEAGDRFQAVDDLKTAREVAAGRAARERQAGPAEAPKVTLENLMDRMAAGQVHELRLVLKADVKGSAEVLADYLSQIRTDELRTRIVYAGVGAVTESDVDLADVSGAVIVAFGTDVDPRAQVRAREKNIQIRRHRIIYELAEEVKASLEGMLEPVETEVPQGKLEVLEIFQLSRGGTIAGCLVRQGKIERSCLVRLWRGGKVNYTGRVASLRRFKQDVREVEQGLDCGVRLEGHSDYQKGDILETYTIEKVPRKVFSR